MLCDAKLHELHQRGIFPFPKESEGAFEKRAHLCTAGKRAISVFGVAPDWIPITYSRKGLSFFEGAATWVGENPHIQLQPYFLEKSHWLGYSKEELLHHEAVHAMRAQFEEPVYEEHLAYSTSPKWWRRLFGPLFQTPKESYILLFLTLTPLLHPALWAFPLAFLAVKMAKLFLVRRKLRCAIVNYGAGVVLCMSDSEIDQAAKGEFVPDSTLRGRLIKHLMHKGV